MVPLLVLLSVLLLPGLIALLHDDISIEYKVEGHLIHELICPIQSLFVRELGEVVGSLGVVGVEGLDHLLLLLLRRYIFLVDAS